MRPGCDAGIRSGSRDAGLRHPAAAVAARCRPRSRCAPSCSPRDGASQQWLSRSCSPHWVRLHLAVCRHDAIIRARWCATAVVRCHDHARPCQRECPPGLRTVAACHVPWPIRASLQQRRTAQAGSDTVPQHRGSDNAALVPIGCSAVRRASWCRPVWRMLRTACRRCHGHGTPPRSPEAPYTRRVRRLVGGRQLCAVSRLTCRAGVAVGRS